LGGGEKDLEYVCILTTNDILLHQSAPKNQSPSYCLPYTRMPKMPNHYKLNPMMANAEFAKMVDNFQHSMHLTHKS
jgi:hypothetical protein